jgi:hypothetical protein
MKLVLLVCAATALVVGISIPQVHFVLKASLRLIRQPSVFAASGNAGGSKGASSAFLGVSSGTHSSLAQNCTVYASASGDDTYTGTTRWAPKTLFGGNPASPGANSAAGVAKPGDVVCLLGGRYELNQTFCPPNTATTWITYQAFGDGDVDFVWTAGVTPAQATGALTDVVSIGFLQPMIRVGSGGYCSGSSQYLKFIGLNLDGGQNNALEGFFCYGSDHAQFIGNTIRDTAGSGIAAVGCDYLVSDHNLINHNGYLPAVCLSNPGSNPPTSPPADIQTACGTASNSSGISYNNVTTPAGDAYLGLHNIISNHIITGEVDQCDFWPAQLCPGATSSSDDFPTDGNGIILDILRQGTAPALVVNNVVYGNGGRCIAVFNYTNFWVVNNTCKKNNLDTQEPGFGSLSAIGASSTGYAGTLNGYFVDNISYVWSANNAIPYYYSDDPAIPSTVVFDANLYYGRTDGACCNFSPQPAQNFISSDRLVADTPFVHPTATGQYAASRPPSAETPTDSASMPCTGWIPICDIASAFAPGSDSPAYNAATDPSSSTFTSGWPQVQTDMRNYIYSDINGDARRGSWVPGAIQRSANLR